MLSIWCRLMQGYGVEAWGCEGVGQAEAALLDAMEKRGVLSVLAREGDDWQARCA